ncbi:MAG TPA: tripartite tricarboxylate transporter substrate binding protein [Xanthobacteraceae bacterium]|nr:tripartite tricarboxylate transporter substrate binding protein [Xanthobacteraceae bacterium]
MKKILICLISANLLASVSAPGRAAEADDYPTRPVRFIQGFAPGGNADIITRVLGAEMSKSLGQPVIPEARVGAGGNIAAQQVAHAEPDGYTLLLVTTAHLVSPALYNSLGYDPINDFAFISSVTNVPFFVVCRTDSPYKTINDLVQAAKAKPGSITVGTAGIGTGQHMALELFSVATGIKVLHVPFRGDSGAVTGLLEKTVDAVVAPGTAVFGNIEGGTFAALATTGSERWPSLKDVPTVSETVAPGFEMIAWIGVGTTHGVPQRVIERLNQAVRHAVATPPVDEKLRSLGGFPKSSTPREATERVEREISMWKELAQKAGLSKR